MNLKTYLEAHGIKPGEFAVQIGEHERAVKNWVYRTREPSLRVVVKIEQQTNGAVTVADLILPPITAA
jgi:hypothetical protein